MAITQILDENEVQTKIEQELSDMKRPEKVEEETKTKKTKVKNEVKSSTQINIGTKNQSLGNISPTFQSQLKDLKEKNEDEVVEDNVSGKKVNSVKNILSSIKIDLNNIEFIDKSVLLQQKDFEGIFPKEKETYQVVCTQSNYVSHMSGLTLSDIDVITNSRLGIYEYRKLLYSIIHSHLETTSIGKIGYSDWLKVTSYQDVPTLMFGIYCMTFPESNNFKIKCGSCEKENSIVINHDNLIDNTDQEIFADLISRVRSIVKVNDPIDLLSISMVHTTERLMLNDSKMVVELITPSLDDHLNLLKTANEKYVERHGTAFGSSLFIKQMGVLDIDNFIKNKTIRYSKVSDKSQVFNIVDSKLSLNDAQQLSESINTRTDNYKIEYRIKSQKCLGCGDSLGDIPVDPEVLLFFEIRERKLM